MVWATRALVQLSPTLEAHEAESVPLGLSRFEPMQARQGSARDQPNTMAARAHTASACCVPRCAMPAVEAEVAVCSVGVEVPLQLPSALRGSVAIDGDVVAVAFAPACTEAEYAHCKVRSQRHPAVQAVGRIRTVHRAMAIRAVLAVMLECADCRTES